MERRTPPKRRSRAALTPISGSTTWSQTATRRSTTPRRPRGACSFPRERAAQPRHARRASSPAPRVTVLAAYDPTQSNLQSVGRGLVVAPERRRPHRRTTRRARLPCRLLLHRAASLSGLGLSLRAGRAALRDRRGTAAAAVAERPDQRPRGLHGDRVRRRRAAATIPSTPGSCSPSPIRG